MILFPNCKINLGLDIISKRPDGYHNIETVMYPVGWHDVLEIVPGETESPRLFTSGNQVDCPPEKNLVMKAYRALSELRDIPPVDIYLHKVIPDGAGLGGGSSDAAFTLRGLNELFGLELTDDELASIAATIGADCPFFIYNRPMLATGIGTDFSPVDLSLGGYNIVIVKPPFGVPTKEAYSRVVPHVPEIKISEVIKAGPESWKGRLKNDFEASVASIHPEIKTIITEMYAQGAVYAAMSGSGSAVFGIFKADILADCERFAPSICYIAKG